jgi:hypothetical protein
MSGTSEYKIPTLRAGPTRPSVFFVTTYHPRRNSKYTQERAQELFMLTLAIKTVEFTRRLQHSLAVKAAESRNLN